MNEADRAGLIDELMRAVDEEIKNGIDLRPPSGHVFRIPAEYTLLMRYLDPIVILHPDALGDSWVQVLSPDAGFLEKQTTSPNKNLGTP